MPEDFQLWLCKGSAEKAHDTMPAAEPVPRCHAGREARTGYPRPGERQRAHAG